MKENAINAMTKKYTAVLIDTVWALFYPHWTNTIDLIQCLTRFVSSETKNFPFYINETKLATKSSIGSNSGFVPPL